MTVTPSGSRDRLVKAEPGPGMLYKKSTVPVKREHPRPPVRHAPTQELEEDSETEESEEETEEESVMSARTDQVRKV